MFSRETDIIQWVCFGLVACFIAMENFGDLLTKYFICGLDGVKSTVEGTDTTMIVCKDDAVFIFKKK